YVESRDTPPFPTRRSSDLLLHDHGYEVVLAACGKSHQRLKELREREGDYTLVETDFSSEQGTQQLRDSLEATYGKLDLLINNARSEEHTSELQSRENLVCR